MNSMSMLPTGTVEQALQAKRALNDANSMALMRQLGAFHTALVLLAVLVTMLLMAEPSLLVFACWLVSITTISYASFKTHVQRANLKAVKKLMPPASSDLAELIIDMCNSYGIERPQQPWIVADYLLVKEKVKLQQATAASASSSPPSKSVVEKLCYRTCL